jgi:hypothetical protein
VSNEKLFEKILHEFCFPHADRNEEQFEMIEVVEKRAVPALSTSTELFENILKEQTQVEFSYPVIGVNSPTEIVIQRHSEEQIKYTFPNGTDVNEWYNF